MTMKQLLFVALLWMLLLLLLFGTMSNAAAQSQVGQLLLPVNNKDLSDKRLLSTTQVLYPIPTFAVSFQSPKHTVVVGTTSSLEQELVSPLRLITMEFLLENIMIEMAHLEPSASTTQLLRTLQGLPLRVTVHVRDDQSNNGGYIQIQVILEGQAAFLDIPSVTPKPSPTLMYNLLGDWIDRAFSQDFNIYQDSLHQSSYPQLSQHVHLQVDTYYVPPAAVVPATTTLKSLSAMMVIFGGAILGLALWVVTRRRGMMLLRRRCGRGCLTNNKETTLDFNTALPGRYPDPVVDLASEQADEYLKTKPDVLQTVQRSNNHNNKSQQELTNDEESRVLVHTPISPIIQTTLPLGRWKRLLHPTTTSLPPLECDQDPRRYNFAFSDFPRHDGTPCLIYSSQNNARAVFLPEATTESPPADGDTVESILSRDDDDDESLEFKQRLERMVYLRRRHYEQQRLLDKANKRKKDEEEARQRELLLRRHEMELDLQEIEKATTTTRREHRTSLSDTEFLTDAGTDLFSDIVPPLTVSDSSESALLSTPTSSTRPPTVPRKPLHDVVLGQSARTHNNKKHRHRRSSSQGTNVLMDDKMSNDDIMTFGIAAYMV